MVHLPNWVDLIILIIVFRTSYNGFGRGIVTELVNLVGVIAVVVGTIWFWPTAAGWVVSKTTWHSPYISVAVFWVLFIFLMVLMRFFFKAITDVIRWEHLHWLLQGLGLVIGCLRGLWWAGFLLIVLTSSNLEALQSSVQGKSLLGPHLEAISRERIVQMLGYFPKRPLGSSALVPPLRVNPT